MNFFYFSKDYIALILVLIFLVIFIYPPLGIFLLFFFSFILFTLREKKFSSQGALNLSNRLFLSPVSGKVIEISEGDEKMILLKQSFWKGWGVYSPLKSRVNIVSNQATTRFEMESKHFTYHLEFLAKIGFSKLETPLQVGDIANPKACFGFFRFPGVCKLIFPKELRILVEKGQKVTSTKTFLAQYEEEK